MHMENAYFSWEIQHLDMCGISSLRVARVHVQDTRLASIIPFLAFFRSHRLFNAGFTCWPNEHDCLMVSPTELLASAEECWEGR